LRVADFLQEQFPQAEAVFQAAPRELAQVRFIFCIHHRAILPTPTLRLQRQTYVNANQREGYVVATLRDVIFTFLPTRR
jgi:hypothetical protein